jgi:hypothetical protein
LKDGRDIDQRILQRQKGIILFLTYKGYCQHCYNKRQNNQREAFKFYMIWEPSDMGTQISRDTILCLDSMKNKQPSINGTGEKM